GPRLRGARLPVLVAPQPVSADPSAALPPRQGGGDSRRASLSRPGVQSLPLFRRDAARRPGGDRAGLRDTGADGAEPLPPHSGGASSPWHRGAAGDAGRGDRGGGGVRAGPADPGRARLQPLRRDQALGVGGVPRAGHAVRNRAVPTDPLRKLSSVSLKPGARGTAWPAPLRTSRRASSRSASASQSVSSPRWCPPETTMTGIPEAAIASRSGRASLGERPPLAASTASWPS